jgi:polyphosphate kinase
LLRRTRAMRMRARRVTEAGGRHEMTTRGLLLADRELSWIAFNGRVLQEAADPSVALGDRTDFLAIVSSNLDEFFRVRVASLRSLSRLSESGKKQLDFDPGELLSSIHAAVDAQQTRFGAIFREQLVPALRECGVQLAGVGEIVGGVQREELRRFFDARVRSLLQPLLLDGGVETPFLENRGLYLVVELRGAGGGGSYALVRIPAELPRWVEVAGPAGVRTVLFLDDVIRLHLDGLFGVDGEAVRAWSVKLSRDAELQLEDEFGSDLVMAMRQAVRRRARGTPCRFLYDAAMPAELVQRLQAELDLAVEDLFPGGRYHNLHDLFTLPRPSSIREPAPALLAPSLDVSNVFAEVVARDRLLHFPYQSYEGVLGFLRAGADDPMVEEVFITLYRVARESAVVEALVRAAKNGKRVTAFIEARARFDEETNLDCGEKLEAAGARVRYGRPGVKVHAKLALVTRSEGGERRGYAYLGTGNFNERTARVYADTALLTAEPVLAGEVRALFGWLWDETGELPRFERLLVAPFSLRSRLTAMIEAEADAARAGRPSGITLKLNSLEDAAIIDALYGAALAGVPIRLIVRGICRLVPDQPELGDRIEARSIVDRYLEHARVYRFHAGGEDRMYLASADLMTRNLDRRVEVAFPIDDERARQEIGRMLELQLGDNVKARRIDAAMSNAYVRGGGERLRAQVAFREYLAGRVGGRPEG